MCSSAGCKGPVDDIDQDLPPKKPSKNEIDSIIDNMIDAHKKSIVNLNKLRTKFKTNDNAAEIKKLLEKLI